MDDKIHIKSDQSSLIFSSLTTYGHTSTSLTRLTFEVYTPISLLYSTKPLKHFMKSLGAGTRCLVSVDEKGVMRIVNMCGVGDDYCFISCRLDPLVEE